MKISIGFIPALLLCGTMSIAQAPPQAQAPRRPAGPISPIVLPDGRVTFNLLAPGANTVTFSAEDYSPIGRNLPMTKDANGVWSITVGPLTDDLYGYRFVVDGVPTLDPRNHFMVREGTTYFNWAVVPGPHASNYMVNDGPHGLLSEIWYPSPTLKMTRRMSVYTPPGYDSGSARYPVLYLINGGAGDENEWVDMGRAPEIFDNLIAQGKMVPTIVVMGNGTTRLAHGPEVVDAVPEKYESAAPPAPQNPNASGQNLILYPDSLVHDIIPFIDKNYRTTADRDHRAVAGLSMGGAQTTHSILAYTDTFSWACILSPAVPILPGVGQVLPRQADADKRRGPGIGQTIDPAKFAQTYPVIGPQLNQRLHLLLVGIGKDDGLVEATHAFTKLLDDKGVKYVAYDLPGYGHEWEFWRLSLVEFSQRMFKTGN